MLTPIILYRRDGTMTDAELAEAQRRFNCTPSRNSIPPGSLVIGRYSVLPYYEELEEDVRRARSQMINSWRQHEYVADVRRWTEDLGNLTMPCWAADQSELAWLPDDGRSFVLKGATNSRKHQWNTHMFAKDKAAAVAVAMRLMDDSLISQQPIVVREYVPLRRLTTGLNGLPISLEHRLFVCYGAIISRGFYWSSHLDDIGQIPNPFDIPEDFLREAVGRIGNEVSFYTLDVAQKEDGGWIVVELNDGQMSGLSENDPETLYRGLQRAVLK